MSTPIAGLHCRVEGPADGPVALLVHGFPESSFMWRFVAAGLGEAGIRAVAPDLPGYGDSPPAADGSWATHVEALDRVHDALGRPPVALVMHDWGGLIGLRWAVERSPQLTALVVSSTGFFADGTWHGLADLLRTPGRGEEFVDGLTRESLGQLLQSVSPAMEDAAIDEYAKVLGDESRRRRVLELYRSGEFAELARHEGALGRLGVPALVLWGESDPFAPVAGAHRFVDELGPDTELVIVVDAGHFLYADAPARTTEEVMSFLTRHLVR